MGLLPPQASSQPVSRGGVGTSPRSPRPIATTEARLGDLDRMPFETPRTQPRATFLTGMGMEVEMEMVQPVP